MLAGFIRQWYRVLVASFVGVGARVADVYRHSIAIPSCVFQRGES